MAFNKDAIKSIEFSILPSDNRNVTFLKIDMIYDFTASYHEYGKTWFIFADKNDQGSAYQFYEVRRNNKVVQYTCTIAEEANKPNPIVRLIKSKDRTRIAGIKFNDFYERNRANSYSVVDVTNDKVVCVSRLESQNSLFHPVNRVYNETKNISLTAVVDGLEESKTIQADIGHDGTNFNFIPKQPIPEGYVVAAEDLDWLSISPMISNQNLVSKDLSVSNFRVTGNVHLPNRSSYTFPITGFISPRSASEAMMSANGAWRHGNMNMDPYIFEPNKYSPYRQFDKNRQFDSRYFGYMAQNSNAEHGPAMTPYTNAYIDFGAETEMVSSIRFPVATNANRDILIIDPNTVPGTTLTLDSIVGVSLKHGLSNDEFRPVFLFNALVKGTLTLKLSELPMSKLSRELFGKIDLSKPITISPNYEAVYDGGVFAAERGGITPNDIESIEYRDGSITVNLTENANGNILLKFSNAKNKFDSELTPETDRDYTSEIRLTANGSKKQIKATVSQFNPEVSLYGNIRYININGARLKFYAKIDADGRHVVYYPAKGETVPEWLSYIKAVSFMFNSGTRENNREPYNKSVSAIVTGDEADPFFGFSPQREYEIVRSDDIHNIAQVDFEARISNLANHYFIIRRDADGDKLLINAKYVKENKTQYLVTTVPGTTETIHTITSDSPVVGKSLLDVPQDVFDRGLISVLSGNEMTINESLLPAGVKRSTKIVLRYLDGRTIIGTYIPGTEKAMAEMITMDVSDLTNIGFNEGDRIIATLVSGDVTETRNLVVKYVEREDNGMTTKVYFSPPPTVAFDKSLIYQVAITYDSRNRTGTAVLKTTKPISGPIRFNLSEINGNKFNLNDVSGRIIVGDIFQDLNSDIIFNAAGNGETTFTMSLNASHFKINASDLEKLVFANNQWTAHFKSNLTGNVQIDISTVHAEYEDDFLRNTRRSSASRRFSFTLNNSRTSTVSATGWNAKHSLYGNIVYAWVGNEQVKFFAVIGDSRDQTLLLPYEKAQELNLIPDLHLTATVNSDGAGIRAAAKGTNNRFLYDFINETSWNGNDNEYFYSASYGEETFSYLVSAVNDVEKQHIRYEYNGKVNLPEGHPEHGVGLRLNAKVIRANKTEFHFQPKKTFNISTAITTGKSLFEVPQEIFDRGLIEGFTLGDYNYVDNPVTFKAGLLPSDIKRMVGFEVMSNIDPTRVLFTLYTQGYDNLYDRNTIDNEKLLVDPRELGQHRIVLKVNGGYTEDRFVNITAVRKVHEDGIDKYYINISPKGVQATQSFSINLIESVNFIPNSGETGGTLKVNFKSSVEGHIQFALKDVPDDKKFDIVKKLLNPDVEYQATASNARSIDIPVSKREFVRVKPSGVVSIEYSENQWKLMVDSGNCGFLSATISDQSEMFEEDFLASSQANTESGRTVEFASLSGLGGANLITIPASARHNSNNTLYGNVVYIWLNGERKRFVALIKSNGDVEYIPKETGYARMFPVDCFDVMINSDKAVISHSGTQPESGVYLSGISTFNVQRLVTVVENYGVLRNQLDNFVANRNGNYIEFRYGGEMHRFNMHLEKVNKTQYRYKIQKNPAEFTNPNVVKGNSLFDIPQESMKKSLFKTITYGNGQPPIIEIDSQNITKPFTRYVRTKIYSKVNPNNVIMTIEAESDSADRYISVNSALTSGDTSELGDHRMTFELSDGYIEERRVNLSFIENAGLGRYKMTFAAVGQAPKTKKEILFEKVKSEIVGFRREYNSNTQADDLQLIFKNEQHSPIYIRALNVNGLIGRHERIEGQWDASEWTSEINQLFTDGPYGPFVDIALSQNNTDDEPEDAIWVKFYRLPLTPHQYNLVPTGNESEYGKMLSFTCLRFDTSGNNEISLVVADTADMTTSYSAIPPVAALPSNGRLGDVKVLDTFFPVNTKNDTFSSINQSIQVSTTYVGGLTTSSFSNLVPAALLSGKYTARGTNVSQLANRILSGMRVLFQLGPDYPKMLVYPVVNGNYIDFYPYKVGDNKVAAHPQAGQIIDWLINRGLNNVPATSANGVSRDAFTRPATGLPTNITIPGEESLDSFLSKIREKINAFNEGTSPRAVRNAYVKEVLSRVGLSDSNLYPLFEQTPVTIASAPQPKIISINDVLHNDLNNIVPTNNPDRATLHPGSIDRNTELDILRGGLDRGENLANTYRDFANKLNDAITSIRNTEASNVVNPQTGKPLLSPTVNPAGTVIHMDGENAFNHRITPATRPTKPAQASVKPVKQAYNDKADAYNRYLDALKDRYGYNFDAYKVADTDKFNLARPYVVDMPSTQYGNPEFDKPIDGATPGDLIGFIAEMVYGIQNDRTRNVLETIPGIYIPAVIPAEFRYLGRKDDVIKNQFIRVLNKWIELKPKKGLVREERDAFDALVDELIILSDNPITQSGLEDGSVYSLSTLFKGSLLNQDE